VLYFDGGTRKFTLIDRDRKVQRALWEHRYDDYGVAWAPSGREVWFTGGGSLDTRDVYAVDLEGQKRLVYRSAGTLSLVDTAPDGRALLHRALDRYGAMALLPGARAEQDVTVNDNSDIGALSADGRLLLLNSVSEGVGSTYFRRDGGDPVRLAPGEGVDISSDGGSALVVTDAGELSVVPIGAGLSRKLDLGDLRAARGAWIRSLGDGVIVRARERPDQPFTLWLIDEGGSKPRRLGVGALGSWAVAPDGRHVATKTATDTITILPLAEGPSRAIRGFDVNLALSRWSGDGRSLFLVRAGGWPCEIHRLDLATEKVELWKQVAPPDPTGMVFCAAILPSADGRSYVYSGVRSLASLVVAEGLQ
jgi:dipeptidyl aminopeptidase/acylaminoacyl peptidase